MTVKRNKNVRMSKYSNAQLMTMDVIDVYKLVISGEVVRFPPGFWENEEALENSIICTKYMIEEILQWSIEDVKSNIRVETFVNNKLGGMLQSLYGNSPYAILSLVYKDKFMPWELHECPKSTWSDKNNRIAAMNWLFNVRLKWTREDIINHYNNQVLIDNDLGGLLSEGGQGSSFKLLNEYMEGEFKPWELKSSPVSLGYWSKKENRVYAIRDLIENVLKFDEEQVKKYLNQELFVKNNLNGLIMNYYNGSPFKALDEAYPNTYLPWELSCTPSNYWNSKENRIKATKWLFEIRLKWSVEDIKKNVSQRVFIENGLGALAVKLKGGLYSLVNEAYPEIRKWEFPFVSVSYWHEEENRVDALDYLFKEKLQWSVEDIKKNISQKLLMENNLAGLLKYYNGSPYQLVSDYLKEENIKAWELPVVPNGFWKKDENCLDAIKWLIEKFDINKDNIDKVTKSFLIENSVYGLVFNKYNKSMKDFKNDLYIMLDSGML